MLKHGPFPESFSYLVNDGKITKEGRWLMLACDMGLSFAELCVLVYIVRYCTGTISRQMIHDFFVGVMPLQRVVNTLSKLKSAKYVNADATSLAVTDKTKSLVDSHKIEFQQLHLYVETLTKSKKTNVPMVKDAPRKNFEGITNRSCIRKNSKVYHMLKHGPFPESFSYLVNDGKITKEGRWLMLACDMGLSFAELCVLVYIVRYCTGTISRQMIHDFFVGVMPLQRVVDILSKLKSAKYVNADATSLAVTDKTKSLVDSHKIEFQQLHLYVETLTKSKKTNVPMVKDTPRKNFEGITNRSCIRKNSKVYHMLKHGPFPESFSYLVNDGKITKEGRWLLLACDMGLSFAELCVLVYIVRYCTGTILRQMIHDFFVGVMPLQRVVDILSKLKSAKYVNADATSLAVTDKTKSLVDSHKIEFQQLHLYVETLTKSKKTNVPMVKDAPRKNFEGITNRSCIRKNSKVYHMLKHGPFPESFSYLVNDGKITKEGRWLLLACDMGLSFAELCVLVYIVRYCTGTISRQMIHDFFVGVMPLQRVVNTLSKLKSAKYVNADATSLAVTDKTKSLVDSHKIEFQQLHLYVETLKKSKKTNVPMVKDAPRKNFEGITNRSCIRKNSKVYHMLKHGPFPESFSYLVNDGKITKEGRWLMLACDMGLSFAELCVLVYIVRYCTGTISRQMIHDFFVGVMPLQRVVDILSKLKSAKYVNADATSLAVTGKTRILIDSQQSDLLKLYQYVETLKKSKKNNVQMVKDTPRKNFEGITNNSYIRKNSKVYHMLKHGPFPESFSYLVNDGKITKEGRWLLLACDMGLSFAELCVLGYLVMLHRSWLKDPGSMSWMHRPLVYTSFDEFLGFWSVQKFFAKFKKMGFIKVHTPGLRAVKFNPGFIDAFIKSHTRELDELEVYVKEHLELPL